MLVCVLSAVCYVTSSSSRNQKNPNLWQVIGLFRSGEMEVTVMEEADTDLIRKQEDDHEGENDDEDGEEEIPDCHATVYRVKPKV